MCGILVSYSTNEHSCGEDVFRGLLDSLCHRGPDDSGIWSDPAAGVTLGHRRLSILDLSELGHQPMRSHDGRWIVVYNGEIYNWRDLRKDLQNTGKVFQTRTDTEVLIEAISTWGLKATLQKTVGMFAFAAWDRQERRLVIARDRLGEKPLYFARKEGAWWITSELKAFARIPGCSWELDSHAVALFLRYKYIPDPYSIYRDVKKLTPGYFAELKTDGTADLEPYWRLEDVVLNGQRNPFQGTEEEAAERLEALLQKAIADQRVADVPVGAFLSGGIDSSTVVALMQAQGRGAVHTFTIGFEEAGYDESQYAAAVAKHLGTQHTELRVTPSEAMSVIPELPTIYDEPFGDSSAIPTILVSRLARRQVTVALSGDGGDEVFGGYSRYHQLLSLWNEIAGSPKALRSGLAYMHQLGEKTAAGLGQEEIARKFGWRKRYARIASFQELYYNILTHYCSLDETLLDADHSADESRSFDLGSPLHYAMARDTVEYLPGDILVKVDRAAMSCSLETRIPILDHRCVEWAWTLPERFKIDEKNTKKVLKNVLHKYVPPHFFDRRKMGFGVPVGEWVRGPLLDWAESLLSESALRSTGILDPTKTRSLWAAHRDRHVNDQYRIWPILMLQAWLLHSNSN